jgi:hypothetical protein
MTTASIPPEHAGEPAAHTSGDCVTGILHPGDRFGRSTVKAGHCGVTFCNGRTVVCTIGDFAAFGHSLVAQFDPPGFDDVEAAGLCGNGTDGTGPYSWRDVARAALRRPTTIYVAQIATSHYDWLGIGSTDDQARDSLMHAWRQHAAYTGADPDHIRRDELTVHHGVAGTGWRDDTIFPPLPQHH